MRQLKKSKRYVCDPPAVSYKNITPCSGRKMRREKAPSVIDLENGGKGHRAIKINGNTLLSLFLNYIKLKMNII